MQTADMEILKEQSRCISHEIRNQLSVCDVYSEIIKKHLEKENIENPSILNAISCIKKSVKMINNSLLDLKSINNYAMKNVDLKNIVSEGINLATVYTGEKNITFNVGLLNSNLIFVDENKFLACLVNIIKNAVEAIEEKGIINVFTCVKNDVAYIRISNNGDPILKEKQEHIFNDGYTTKLTGSGLGLHICRHNLKAQNAELKLVQSNEDITEFEIAVPVLK